MNTITINGQTTTLVPGTAYRFTSLGEDLHRVYSYDNDNTLNFSGLVVFKDAVTAITEAEMPRR